MELEIEEDLKKIERDYTTSNKAQKDLQKQISDQLKILKIHNSKQSTQIQINERRKKLFQFEKDLKTNVQKLEQVISEMSRFIDSLENDQSELESEINLVDNDNKLFEMLPPSTKAVYVPIPINAPWAKLICPAKPDTIFNPHAPIDVNIA